MALIVASQDSPLGGGDKLGFVQIGRGVGDDAIVRINRFLTGYSVDSTTASSFNFSFNDDRTVVTEASPFDTPNDVTLGTPTASVTADLDGEITFSLPTDLYAGPPLDFPYGIVVRATLSKSGEPTLVVPLLVAVTEFEGAQRDVSGTASKDGLPRGGAANEVLGKLSAADFDVGWVVGGGGNGGGGLSQSQVEGIINQEVEDFAKTDLPASTIPNSRLNNALRDNIDGSAKANTLTVSGQNISITDNEGNVRRQTLPSGGGGGGENNPPNASLSEVQIGTETGLRSFSVLRIWQAIRSFFSRENRDVEHGLSYSRDFASYSLSQGNIAGEVFDTGWNIFDADSELAISLAGVTGSAIVDLDELRGKTRIPAGTDVLLSVADDHVAFTIDSRQYFAALTSGGDILVGSGTIADTQTVNGIATGYVLEDAANRKRMNVRWIKDKLPSDTAYQDDLPVVENSGTELTGGKPNRFNFTGDGVTAAQSGRKVTVTIPGGGNGGGDDEEWPAGSALPTANTKDTGDKYNLSGVEYRVEETASRNELHIVTTGTDGNYIGARKRAGVSNIGSFSDSGLTGYQVYFYNSEVVPQGTASTIIALPRSVIGSSPPNDLYVILVSADRAVAYIQLSRASGSDTSDTFVWQATTGNQFEPTAQAPILAQFFSGGFSTPMNVVASSKRWVLDDADDKLNADAVDKRIEDGVEDWARDSTTAIPAGKLTNAEVTDGKILDAAKENRTVADRNMVLATSSTDQNDLVLTAFPRPEHATLLQDDVGIGVTVTNSGQTFRSSPTANAFDTALDIDDNPHGHFVIVADIRLATRGSNTIGFDTDTSNPQLTARLNSIISATELAATSDYDSSQMHGVQIGDQDVRNGSATLGRIELLLVHDSTGQVRYDVIAHSGSGSLNYSIAIDRIYAYFVPSDAPAASTGTTLNDDAVLDLFDETRVTGDRGRTLAVSTTDENALAFGYRFQQVTQTAYDAIGTKDANTLYIIIG